MTFSCSSRLIISMFVTLQMPESLANSNLKNKSNFKIIIKLTLSPKSEAGNVTFCEVSEITQNFFCALSSLSAILSNNQKNLSNYRVLKCQQTGQVIQVCCQAVPQHLVIELSARHRVIYSLNQLIRNVISVDWLPVIKTVWSTIEFTKVRDFINDIRLYIQVFFMKPSCTKQLLDCLKHNKL